MPQEISLHEEETGNKDVPSPNSSTELVGNPNRKDGLADALVKVFERLLNGQGSNDPQLDSCASDSELSEVETSSTQDVPSDDEGSTKNQDSENLDDASSTNSSPRPTEPKTEDPEGHPETDDNTSFPVIFKLPPRIENILNIERFNMSRLLRDEYIDKIRRGREKLRRVKAKKEQKNGEMVSKFQDEVKTLLEDVEFGETGGEEKIPPRQRQKLTATPSYDSGIVDPVEQDKEDVVKKYKELLEKARRDLNRAHRALKARNSGRGEVMDEIAAMKRSAKEAKNDLDELEGKRSDLDHERGVLLEKIKDAQNSANINDERQGTESETVQKDMDKRAEELENNIKKLCEEKMAAEEEVKELQRKLVAGTGGEDILKDLQEKLTDVNDKKSRLDEKCAELESEKLEKDERFETAMKGKEQEVSELQKKLVAGTGGEDILKELQGNLEKAKDEKLEVVEKCSGLEKAIKEKEEELRKSEEEMEALERKSVEGTGAEEIVEKLQGKLNETKAEKATVEERCHELNEIEKKNKELANVKEHQQQEVNELQRKLVAGTGGEDILKDLQEKLQETKEQNSSVEQNNSDLQKEIERKEKAFSDEKKKMEAEINDLQTKLVAGTGGEEILNDLQEKKQEAEKQKSSLEERNVELEKEIERKDKNTRDEINELQRNLVVGTGGEGILQDMQEKLQEAKEQKTSLEERNSELQKEIERKEKASSDGEKMMREEINDLQRQLVAGTGGEEILKDLQDNLQEAKEKNSSLEQRNSELQRGIKENEKTFSDNEKKMEDEINDLQRKLVAGTGGEEILAELQDTLRQAKEDKAALHTKCEELEDKGNEKNRELSNEIKEKENEINELQKKLVSGTGGEEILTELQDKLEKSKEENVALQTKCEELEGKAKASNKEFGDEVKRKENEINELQKRLVSGTGGEEILAELQGELEREKEENAALQTKCDKLEDTVKTRDKEYIKEIKEKDDEISDLQKKLLSGTGGEEILAESQNKLERGNEEKTALQTKCEHLEDKAKAKDKEFGKEIKERDTKINELQKKLVSGTGGEEILAELQDELARGKGENTALQTNCEDLEDRAKTKDEQFSKDIKEKDNEISDLQKKLVSGTGGEEILAELQDKLENAKKEKDALQTNCEDHEERAKAKEEEFSKKIKEKDNEISDLQKKMVSGTGGEEILAELQDKLENATKEKDALQTKCENLEDKAKAKYREFSDEIKEKDIEISDLQKKLVSGTGGEEILAELQDKLERGKEEKTALQTKCEDLEDKAKAKDKEFGKEIKERDTRINELQKKLVSGTGGEEILAELQDELARGKEENTILQTKCEDLEDRAKANDDEFGKAIKEKDNEINDLQEKLVSGTGGEEILAELQDKLENATKEKDALQTKCENLEDKAKAKYREFSDEIKEKDIEISDLQKKLVSGTGGEEILAELQDKLERGKEEKTALQTKCEDLEDKAKAKDKEFGKEIKERDTRINELQKKLVSGTGGEEILAELQDELARGKEENTILQTKCEDLEDRAKANDDEFGKAIKEKDNEINDLQEKLVSGTGGEEILAELQDKLENAKKEKDALQTKCEEFKDKAKAKNKEFSDEIREKDNEISDLQKKLVSGTGGEEILAELQDKLERGKDENGALQTKCDKLEDTVKARDREYIDEINEKDNEVSDLQKKLVSGTGGEEILAELQDKLENAKKEKDALQTNCEDLEDRAKAKEEEFSKKIKEKDNEISDLQKKMVSGTGGEEILAELQDKLENATKEKDALQTKCENLEDKAKAKYREFSDEIKEKDIEISDLQKKLVSGTGGEEILAELQDKLERGKEEKTALQTKCEDLEDKAKAKDKELGKEIKERDTRINELQKKLVSGTGGEEILAELQDELARGKEENTILQTKCEDLEDRAKANDDECGREIKEKDNEINDLQKKLVSGTGGEEILAELQDKLENAKKEKDALQTKCEEFEDKAKAKNKEFSDEIREKDNEISDLQKKLVSGTGGEEILAELQDKLERGKDENAVLQTKCDKLEDTVKAKDKEYINEIKEKDNEICDLQKKLVSGTGGEEIIAELQDKLERGKDENAALQTKCDKLEDTVKARDREYIDEIKEKDNEISDLQKKLVTGTGGEEILAELQDKLENAKKEKDALQTKCEDLQDRAKAKDEQFSKEIKEKDNEISDLQKKLVSGTEGEEILAELQNKLERGKDENAALQTKCDKLEDTVKARDREYIDEIKEKDNEISDLQKMLVTGTGGKEILAELQDKFENAKKEKDALQTNREDLEDRTKAKDEQFSKEIKEKDNEISDLQKKLVSGTEGEEILAELQNKLERGKEEKTALQTKCEDLEDKAKTKDKAFGEEIKERDTKINELQKKMVSGTGGEEILAELQDELARGKEENTILQTKCEDLEDRAKAKEEEFSKEIKEKDNEISDLQKKLVSGTGGEEILAELQDKLGREKEENGALQTKCDKLEDTVKARDKECIDEIKEKDNEISDLQKKLVTGTGGEEILAELQDKLENAKKEKDALQTNREDLEDKAKAKDEEFSKEIKEKDNEIRDLEKRLVNGTGGEEILAELQDKLERGKEENAALQTKCEDLEDRAKAKDEEFSKEIKEKDNEISDLQKKLVSGTGGEEILAELQDKLERGNEEKTALQTKCEDLEDKTKAKDKEFGKEIKGKDTKINELQKKLVSGTGGEEIVAELQDELAREKEENTILQTNCEDLEDRAKAKDELFSKEIKEKDNEISDLQKKLVSGTGGEEILAELQDKLASGKEEKTILQTKCEDLEDRTKARDKEYIDEIKEKDNEINDLQKKLVTGTGGEEIFAELQDKLENAKKEKDALQAKCEDLEGREKAKDEQFSKEIKEKDNEISDLQKKMVSGTGGEEILAELQDKLERGKDENGALQTKCDKLEDTVKARDKEYIDEIKEKDNEISDLQKKLVTGTGGEEILAELQDKLENAKKEKDALQTKCEDLEDRAKAKDEQFSKEIKEKDNEINDLQKKLVSGTEGEEILAELQDKLERGNEEKTALQTKCEDLEDKAKAKDKEFGKEIKGKETKINELQKKLVSGTGGEEIVAELQDELARGKEENAVLQTNCEDLEDRAKAKDEEFSKEIKEKDNEISDLQKKLVSGTGGEEILAELQDKLENAKKEKDALQTKCEDLEDRTKAKDKQFSKEIKENENEISDLQKKLVSGTGGEEILAELQDKLERGREEKTALQTKCEDPEDKAKAKDKEFGKEIKGRDTKINELQKKLVSGTGGEEIVAELQDELARRKEENTILQTNCEDLEDTTKTKDEEFSKDIKEKDNEISDLQKKLVSGTGGEEILAELQDKLERGNEENAALQTKCDKLEDTVKARDKEYIDEIKEKDNEISDLLKKLVSGTGGDEILAELQDKLENAKKEKDDLQTKCEDLEDSSKAKDEQFSKEIKEKDNEISNLQKKLVSGSGGEEILAELQDKLERGKEEKTALQIKCEDLEDKAKAKDNEFGKEIKERDTRINELQKKLVSGTGGEEILAELQDELKEAKNENAVLQAQCSGDENKAAAREKGLEDEMKVKEYEIQNLQRQLVSGTGCEEMLNELQDKLKITKEENAGLQEECSQLEENLVAKDKEFNGKIKQKDAEIFELQRKLVSGSGSEEILLDLQNKLKDTDEEKGKLEERCLELAGEVKLKDKELINQKKENAEEVNDLQRKLIAGTGSEEVLQELQNKLKETEMEKGLMVEKCSILKDEVEKKDMEAKEEKAKRDEEVNKLQKKLLSGTGGEEVLEELQGKLKEAEMEKGILEEKYSKLEDEIEKKDMEAKKEKTKRDEEVNKLQKKLISGTGGEEILEELQEKLKGAEKEKQKLERTCAELDGDIEKKDKQLQRKDEEVNDLQKKIVAGTGGEDLLGELQEKLRDAKKSEKALEKRCYGFEKDLQEKDDGNKNKQNEIEELQRKLLSGTGGEEVLLDLQEKLNEADKEKTMLESKLAELETDSEEIDAKFAKLLNDKQEEIDRLQRDSVEGTEAEEVVADLQEKLAVANKETKKLEAKCHELEKCKRQKNLDRDDGKELKRLQAANKVLENENEAKQDKINELQFKMIQGTGGEDVLKDLQNDLSEANEKNKELEIRNAELEQGRDDLDEYGEGNIAAVLKEENERLEANNNKIVEKLENLQKDVVNGTGSEELLQELQNEIKELSSENSELRKEKREKEATSLGGKDVKQLEKDLNKANLERKHLISDNESKDEEIADLQKKLVAGSGGEELLANLQQEIKALKDANKNMAIQCHDVEEMNKDMIDEKEKYKKLEKRLFMAKMENEKLAEENEAKDKEICELQKLIVDGSGAEELLKTLQDKIKETAEDNKALEKKCSDLESNTVGLAEDTEHLQQRLIDLAEAENEIQRLAQGCDEKNRQIVELQRKLVAGTGCEDMLEDLQNQVKNLQENNDLERKLARSRKDAIALEGLEKKNKGRKNERKVPDRFGHVGTDDNFAIGKLKSKDVSSRDQEFGGLLHRDGTEVVDEDIKEPLTYEECLQMIPEIKEEKDYWQEKYKALRMKVGGQFVDIIPDVWNDETTLEKEREEILSQLSKLRQEITERETPVVKTVSEQERIETELSGVEDDLEVCSGNLEQLREMQNEQKLIGKNEEKLMECLHELGLKNDSLVESDSKEGKSSEVPMIRDGSDIEVLERKLEQLYNEVEELLTEEQNLKDREKDINCLVDEKINTENEIQEIEAAIQNLQKGLSAQNNLDPSYSSFNRNTNPKSEGINNELEKIQHEINILQSSFETPSSSSGQEVNNLLDLMKEKSKLEDELTDTEKSLNQLGKREYETLVKERETHEKIAKKLLELSREKEVTEGELQELEALAQEKESKLQKSFNTELASKEATDTSSKKRRGFRKRKSSSEVKSADPGSVSSAEEGFSEIDLGEPPLSSDAALALSEELGSLIQKKSSLAVRLEGLGKEITAQSLKVEKSLIGVKDDPSAEPSLGAGYASVEDLTQSQMSIFDDYNMVDELSLATGIVREQRVKRKSSRKAPMSKLLKEKSALEKKLKESQGKVLVQNTKVKNALKEEKDARKAKEKFVQAAQDRKAVENDLSNVCSKIDELASEEGSVKEKKAKTPKGRKSMSKNDKRRLLSQRESLGKQLDTIKKKIENFSLDGEDAELADFPEMKEAGNIGNTVERLRELLAREAELKQELNRLTSKELSESSGSGMISDSGSSDEGAGGMLDNRGELGKRDDKDRHMKDVGETSDSGALDESFDNKGMLKEMFRDVGSQVKSLSSAKDEHETEATPPTTQTEDNSNTTIDYGKASLLEKGAQSRTNTSLLPQTNYSKDTMLSSEKDGKMVADRSAPYSEVMELLLKEKAKKEAKLSGLEKEIEHEESGGDKTNDADLVSQRKREDLKNKMKLALNELQQRKEALDESKNVLRNSTKGSSEDPEQVLVDSRIALTQQKDKLEADLVAVKDELDKQTHSGESLDDISADYQVYKDIKSKEKDLVASLDKVNDKLHKRKDWSAMDNPGEENKTNLAETYADILKRMTEENLNMADLIHELEETKETLSKERGITSELLDLIKSRVGNELLEALMGEGLQSPSIEIREMGMFGGEEYPELFDEVENDTVTVAAIIDDYKKVNQFLFKENQKLHEKIELLKVKVDEDLFASIVDQDSTVDIEISKKHEISKILVNNQTLFEQIVSSTESQDEELQSLRLELDGVRKADKENKESDLSKMREKVEDISIELDEAKKRREELVHKLKDLENDLNCSNETFEIAGEEHGHSTAIVDSSPNESNESQNQANSTEKMDKSIGNKQELKELGATKEDVDGSSDKLNEIQNLAGLTKEGDESKQKDQDIILQEVRSSLKEAEELGNRVDIELERLSKELVETETPEAGIRKGNAVKQSDGLGSELNKEYGNEDFGSGDGRGYNEDDRRYRKDNAGYSKDDQESDEDDKQDNEGLNEKMSRVENLQKAFVAKLDEVQKLQEKLKRNLEDSVRDEIEIQNESLKRKLANLEIENEELVSKLQKIEAMNEELRNNLELSKETCDENTELKAKTQSLEKEIEETIAKLNETHKERDEVIEEFENLQKEKKNIEEHLSSAGNENSELKEKMADLQNDKEELTTNLNESNKGRDEIAVELKNLQEDVEALKETSSLLEKANDEMKEKIRDLENENEEITAKLNEANENNKEIAKNVEDLGMEKKSLQDLLDVQRKENHESEEKIQCGKDELLVKLNEADRIRQEVVEDLGNYEENNKSLEEKIGTLENENKELNEVIRALKNENEEGIVKLNETHKERDEVIEEFENLQKEKKNIEEHLSSAGNENSELKEKMADLQNDKEELTTNLNESNKGRDEIAVELKNLQEDVEALKETSSLLEKANDEMKEKIRDLENENEEITAKLNEANENNKEIAKNVEDLGMEKKSLQDLLDVQRKENHESEEKIQCGKDELLVKLNEADRIRQEVVEDLGNYEENNKSLEEKIGTLENENKELNEVIRALKNENEEGIVKLNEIKETIKENEEKLKSLNDLAQENESLKERLGYVENENKKLKDEIQENESIKETLASLENENNEIIPKMERLEKLNKELEDEIEYLRKEEKDFESLNEKLKANEFDRENIKEELGDLRNDMEEIEDFVRENLGQDTGNGVISALEKCKENCEKNGKQNNLLKAEVEKMKKIQNVVGDNLSEKLLDLSKEGMILNDTQEIPKCVEGLVKDKNTLASVLNEYENDLDKVKQHLGEDLFSLVVGKDAGLNGEENDQRLKMAEELRCGRHIEDVVREYEDLINSQASDTETVEHLQEKVNVLEQELEALRKQRDGVLVEDDRGKTSAGDDLRNQNESDVENGGLDGRENSGESVKLSEAAPVAGNVSLIFLFLYSISRHSCHSSCILHAQVSKRPAAVL